MFNSAAVVLRLPIREDVWREIQAEAEARIAPFLAEIAKAQADADAWWEQQMRDMEVHR